MKNKNSLSCWKTTPLVSVLIQLTHPQPIFLILFRYDTTLCLSIAVNTAIYCCASTPLHSTTLCMFHETLMTSRQKIHEGKAFSCVDCTICTAIACCVYGERSLFYDMCCVSFHLILPFFRFPFKYFTYIPYFPHRLYTISIQYSLQYIAGAE
jgi:hypothetical protein